MSDELTGPRAEPRADEDGHADDRVFSGYGVASAVLGVLAVAAAVLAVIIWSGHRAAAEERSYQTGVLQAAADWSNILINMNKDTVDADMQRLHENTVGQLNADFDAAVEPYRQLVQKLQTRTTGQVDSVSIESLHHPVAGGPALAPKPDTQLSSFASRTDTVLVVATSVSENAGGQQPQTVRWTLRLDVSDIDGRLLISRLEPIR
jgi:hypothetical protein